MKLLLLSDLHLSSKKPLARIDDFEKTQMAKLNYVFNYATENDAYILIAGDIFDKPRDWYILPDVIDLLNEFKNMVYVVYGQHDTYMYSEKTRQHTSLGVLERAGLVELIDGEDPAIFNDEDKKVVIYGCSYGQDVPEVYNKDDHNILVIHKEIGHHDHIATIGAKTFLRKNKDFDLILCGDIHVPFYDSINERHIVNTGPMMRRKVGEDHMPHFYLYETESNYLWKEEIPSLEPADVLSKDHIERSKENNEMLSEFLEHINDKMDVEADELVTIIQEVINQEVTSKRMKERIKNVIAEVMEGVWNL